MRSLLGRRRVWLYGGGALLGLALSLLLALVLRS